MSFKPRQQAYLLRLPLEIRQLIYAHLVPQSPTPVYNPIATVGLTAASHAPPRSNLLNIRPQLTDEILDYYYSVTS